MIRVVLNFKKKKKFIYIDGIPPNFSIMFGLWMEGMREEKRESDGRGLNKSYLDFFIKE